MPTSLNETLSVRPDDECVVSLFLPEATLLFWLSSLSLSPSAENYGPRFSKKYFVSALSHDEVPPFHFISSLYHTTGCAKSPIKKKKKVKESKRRKEEEKEKNKNDCTHTHTFRLPIFHWRRQSKQQQQFTF